MTLPNSRAMADVSPPEYKRYHWVSSVLALLAIASTLAALFCFYSYRKDCTRLRKVALAAVAETQSPADRVIAMLHWVYGNQTTSENRRYFFFPRLRATPCQVLETGGDCADKSRLLSAMLREAGIPASMAMCFDPRSGKPTHTVVAATIAPSITMVVDPVYDLFFPKPQPGRYYGLLELRADQSVLPNRLDQLCAERPRSHPIHYYNRETAGYSQASCMNWERNWLTRAVRDLLVQKDSHAIYVIPRPQIIEEPKLLVGVTLLFMAALTTTAFSIVGWLTRRRCGSRERRLLHASGAAPTYVGIGTYPCGR